MKSRVVHVKFGPSCLVKELETKAQFLTPAACKLLRLQIELIPQAAKYEIDVEQGTVTYRKSQFQTAVYNVGGDNCTSSVP